MKIRSHAAFLPLALLMACQGADKKADETPVADTSPATRPDEAQGTTTPDDAKAKQAYALGVQAYLWGYPMVVMQKSRDAMTASEAPVTPTQFKKTGKLVGPVNQVANAWAMLGPNFSAVQSVNSDTLYVIIWADSSEEPYILHIPDTKGRYYTFQFIDAWTNNYHYASTRTMGSQEQEYALVAPGWDGKLPEGVIRIDIPTPTHFIIGRIFVADLKDVPAVNELQKQITMTPLGSYGKQYTPPKVNVVPAKKYSGDLAFFEQLGDTLVINGAPAADAGILGLLKNIGLTTDHGFDPSALSDAEKNALAQAVKDGEPMLAAKSAGLGKNVNGWQYAPVLTEYYGTDYMLRAAIGYQAMFENTPIEAYYPSVFVDVNGETLDASAGNYTMTFPKGGLPPVGAFWSTSMYDQKKRLLVANSLNRYKISSIDKLKTNADGSTTLYLQATSPGKDKESNWLPTPKAPFYMLFRMYLPKIEALNGQYELPGVVKTK
jgi:DNA sulfur modification protein DndE